MRQQIRRRLQAQVQPTSRNLVLDADAEKAENLSSLSPEHRAELLTVASDVVSAYCRLAPSDAPPTFSRETLVETILLSRSSHRLALSREPVSISAVVIDGDAVTLSELFVDDVIGIISFMPDASIVTWPGNKTIEVTYDAGYVTQNQAAENPAPAGPAIPGDLERATILTAQHMLAMQTREQFDVAAEVEEDSDAGRMETRYFNAGRSPGVPGSAQALLSRYIRLV